MLFDLVAQGYDVKHVVSFDYGQRHVRELEYAKSAAWMCFGDDHHSVIKMYDTGLMKFLNASGSSLVSRATDVPEGHYAQDNMKATVVPNRNMMMLSIACSIAVSLDANYIATAVHAGDHFIYPDCRPEFLGKLEQAMVLGNKGFGHFQGILAPYIRESKEYIAGRALDLGVPLDQTWSCYKGEGAHCGRCGTCVERLEAIDMACKVRGYDVATRDHTVYADREYWKQAVKEASNA
jgi:7-cyano-7-deazaguanine synthase